MLSRIRQHVDSERKLGEYFSPGHFQSGFSKSIRTIFKGFQKCFRILKGFSAFQSSRNCFKYSEKQIGFSHGNLCNLHLLSNSSPPKKRGCIHETGFYLPHRYHFDGRGSSESKELRFRLLEIEANAVIY